MQFLVGLDGLNCVELEGDVSGGIGVQNERLAVGFDDGSGEAIAIFQGDLVGERERTEMARRSKQS